MWRTPIGERILLGREWELFSEGLGLLEDQVETWLDDPELSMTGVGVFDRLQLESKLAMLALVGKALHDGDEPCPELTALTEGTFAAVYAALRQFLEVEFDFAREAPAPDDEESPLRTLILATVREVEPEWEGPLPTPDCENLDDWTFLLDMLMDRVLWDRDFDEEDLVLDAEPELGHHLKTELGIADEYFTAIAPEPNDDQLASIRETLHQLSQRPKYRDRPAPEEEDDDLLFEVAPDHLPLGAGWRRNQDARQRDARRDLR